MPLSPFHGGNTGSNPVGDANTSLNAAERLTSADTLGFSSLRWYRTGVQSVSAMTYLWRHQSGVYYFRRAVPDDLRAIIGKTMVKQSLGTRNVAEAKRLAHPIAIQTEADFQSARERRSAPPRTDLTESERAHLVAAYLHHRLAVDESARVEGSKEDDDLYKALKAQVEAHGGTAGFTKGRYLSRF
jgi:uncharacterized protein DUF6538